LAGATTNGYTDATGASARFEYPHFTLPLPSGDLLVADSLAYAIRNVTPSGVVTTYAGGNGAGFLDGSFSIAKFQFPCQLAYDLCSNIYVADTQNHRIRRFTSSNTVETYAGDGTTIRNNGGSRLSTGVSMPTGIGFTSDASLYITSAYDQTVQKIAGDKVYDFAGQPNVAGYVDGRTSNARFFSPTTVATQGLTAYIADECNAAVRKITTYPELRPLLPRTPSNGTIVGTSNFSIVVNPRIDVCWGNPIPINNVAPLFKFEPFDASFNANRCGGETNDILTYSLSSTELIGYLSGTGTSNVLFRGSNGPSVAYTYPLTLRVRATSNTTVVEESSTTVTIGTARIIYSPCNSSLVFYRNEPSPAPVFSLVSTDASLIYSATTLPAGLSFTRTGARSFALTGTPTVQTITSNYTILAFDTSNRTYSTQVSMVVNPERLIIDVSGSLTQTGVSAFTPIESITFTAQFPPYPSYRSMVYSWSPPPPQGLQFYDSNGSAIVGSTYRVEGATTDASFAMTLAGTITESQLRTFALSNVSNYSIVLTGTRTFPTPSLSPSLPRTIRLEFGETIFFTSNVPRLFAGLTVSNFNYSAKTYFPFPTDTSITDIAVTDGFLPDGLAGEFVQSNQRYDISGVPTTAGPYSFTLTATNGASKTTSLPVTGTISNDFITITSPVDTCFNFIQYRSLSNAKTGSYPYPITYSVSSGSGCNTTFTGTSLPAGVTLDLSTSGYVLSGRPTAAAGLTTATLTASVPSTGVSATTTFQYSVSAETFFFSSPTMDFIQNVPITPVTIDVSTLSENSVIRFSSPDVPAALQVENTGRIAGTVETGSAGSFTVTAFTAYSSGNKTYSYTVTPDQVLLLPSVYSVATAPGGTVSIPITGYSLSALTVSNYRFQTPFPYGLGVNSTSGLLSGTLSTSLPASTTFTVLGSAGIVDGSLVGTMTTANLTTDRAALIQIRSLSNIGVYYSDDNGSNWSQAYSANDVAAAQIGAKNGVYLIPTSSDTILRSTTGGSYTTVALGQSGSSPLMTAIVNKPGTSTWWIAGTLSNGGGRSVYVFKSTDDGLTWDAGTDPSVAGFTDRSSNASPSAGVYDSYLYGGVDLTYRDPVLLLGGSDILRSVDDGATWAKYTSSLIEVARFSLDQGTVWVAAGSSLYLSRNTPTYGGDATTFVYSIDQGQTWTNASSGFNMNAFDVVYAEGVWLASGFDWDALAGDFLGSIRYSFDGVNWVALTDIPSVSYSAIPYIRPPGAFSTIAYDEGVWKIIRVDNDASVTLYSHPGDTPMDSGWTSTVITTEFTAGDANTRFLSYSIQTVDPGEDSTTITFPTPTTGPTFTSPAQTTYAVWQYMPIPAIVFTAPGATAYFISELPVGLQWNSATRTITGACMRIGQQTFSVYARDGSGGITVLTVTMIVNVPRIIKKQNGAGAYTALVRDYTEVNAAINARDTRVNPVEEAALGSFASPYAPDVVTPSNCKC
jgi:hypothetical protein